MTGSAVDTRPTPPAVGVRQTVTTAVHERSIGTPRRQTVLDLGLVAALSVVGAVLASRLNFSAHPMEDAAMLMRYAEHLAHGNGLVWNVGAAPVDGATDFLFTVVLAIPLKFGVPATVAVRSLVIASVFLTVVLVALGARRIHHGSRTIAVLAAGWVVLGPGLRLAEACFGAPFFGFTVGLAWTGAWWYRRAPQKFARASWFAAACPVMGLVRPEGVFLAVFMVAALVVDLGPPRCRPLLPGLCAATALGATYFVWRWLYFGYPLPNPYYTKGGGTLHIEGLSSALRSAVTFGWPFLLLELLALAHRATRRVAIFAAIPFAGFALLWLLLSDEMNYLGRFQYPFLVLAAISMPALWTAIRREGIFRGAIERGGWLVRPVGVLVLALLVVAAVDVRIAAFDRDALPSRDGRYAAGRVLAEFTDRHYVLVTTEAGLLPLTSGWTTVDAWGLNDQHIAHDGLSDAYLDRYDPAVIMTHDNASPVDRHPSPDTVRWNAMTHLLDTYATSRGFVHVAAFGETHDSWNFFVRADIPDACVLSRRLRAVDYVVAPDPTPSPDLIPSSVLDAICRGRVARRDRT